MNSTIIIFLKKNYKLQNIYVNKKKNPTAVEQVIM